MSTSSDSSSYKNQFSFQHFDQECDFGILTEDGQHIRKRKRPGRKPNPPSTEKRRAQNRDSQRAYRQRENSRRQEFEKERECYLSEIKELKQKLAQSEYEAKYLRAVVLHFTLSSLTERGAVPHSWANDAVVTDLVGSQPNPKENPFESNPALLTVVLKNGRIVDLSQAMYNTFQADTGINQTKNLPDMSINLESFIAVRCLSMNKGPQQLENSFESQHEGVKEILECSSPSKEEEYIPLKPVLQKEKESVSVKNSQLTMHKKAFRHVLFKPPLLQTADDLAKMTPLQAIHISRLQLKISSLLGPLVSLVLEPTALQKTIPHDIRIDYVPGHSIRDRMILFQDYYDIDECFNYLTQNVVFTGGDIRIVKNWSITDPDFSSKFWFISHEFIDQSSIYHLMKSVDGDLANFTESSIS